MSGRLLITGGSGLLGTVAAAYLRDRLTLVLGLHERRIEMPGALAVQQDLTSVAAAAKAIAAVKPDYVLHAAALTSVEGCEANPALAKQVNVVMAENVASACYRLGVPLTHVSTDHLFDGARALVDEGTFCTPLNMYAATKAEAEQAVLAACPTALIARTNFYGWGPKWRPSFSDTILAELRAGRSPGLFTDVYFTPILIAPLLDGILDLMSAGHCGVFNMVGDDRLSKFDFGRRLAHVFGLDPTLIRPTQLGSRNDLVARPLDMSLSNEKAVRALGRRLGGVDDHLLRLKAEENAAMPDALRAPRLVVE